MPIQILRFPEVKNLTGFSRATLYRRIDEGLFTKSIGLGGVSVGWPAHEVQLINGARISGLSDGEIRVLVRKLHDERKKAISNLLDSSEYARDVSRPRAEQGKAIAHLRA